MKKFLKKHVKNLVPMFALALSMTCILGTTVFADAATNVDLSSFTEALLGSITPAQILTILAQVVGVGMAFFLMWLGVRKAIRTFTSAVANGKIKI